jgi:uncharacterized surface protein with fasciclin (FAS1) repeats
MNSTTIISIIVALLIGAFGGYMLGINKSAAMLDQQKQAMVQDDSSNKMMNDDSKEGVMVGGAMMVPQKDIVDNALGSNDHTTLVAAVKAAGLVETLKGAGPFTVFAPTNEAFAKLPAGTVDMLVKPENKEKLTSILTYHVVQGKYLAKDLKDGMTLTTVNGQTLTVSMKDGKWWINDAMITIPDVVSSNGVTFVIDTVLMPK